MTDVCLDENAVSSDPVVAFLLDEVVVKNWCRLKYKSVVQNLYPICILKTYVSRFSWDFAFLILKFFLVDEIIP